MLTKTQAETITSILSEDPERAKELLALEPEDALAKINALGHDFAIEELIEYSKALKATLKGELDAEALDGVAGGIAPLIAGAWVLGGFVVGLAASNRW